MILYFSGTGNSRLVAQALAEHLQQPLRRWQDVRPDDLEKATAIGFVFPIYAWGLPRVFRDWLVAQAGLPAKAWMVATCGDDIGLTPLELRNLLRPKHCTLVAAFSVQMPNTYVALPGFDVDAPEEQERRLRDYEQRIETIAMFLETIIVEKEVQELQYLDVVEGSFPWLKSRILRPLFNRWLVGDHRFRSTKACIHCRKCEKTCPMGNITMTTEIRPQWNGRCADCFACFHVCPTNAIHYGLWTKGKGQKTVMV